MAGNAKAGAICGRIETWFLPPGGAGTAGMDCESGAGFALQHDILQPAWQHNLATCVLHRGEPACAGRNIVPASTMLQMMAHASFMVVIVSRVGHFC